MAIERLNEGERQGKSHWIEIITGKEGTGKTHELLRRLRRVSIAGQCRQLFTSAGDINNSNDYANFPQKVKLSAIEIAQASEIFEHINDQIEVVGIDNADNFLDIADVSSKLRDRGLRVIVSGGQADHMGDLLCIADGVDILEPIEI